VTVIDQVTAVVCARFGHRWLAYELRGQPDPLMRWAEREFCNRCESNRLLFKDTRDGVHNGEVLVCTAVDVRRLSPAWLEGLYRARWGEYPARRVVVGGEFPAEWRWAE
jgi:hypothetical protein